MVRSLTDGPPHGDDPTPKPGAVDMRPAENWLLRPELIRLCQDAAASLHPRDLSFPYNPRGFPDALQSLAAFFNRRFEPVVTVEERHIVTGPGAGGCLAALLSVICKPGDGVLIPCPYWSGFDSLCANAHVQSLSVPIADDIHQSLSTNPVPALTEALANSKVKIRAVLFTNPHNPLGRSVDPSILTECLRFCGHNDLHYISDEVYALTRFASRDFPGSPKFRSILSFDLQSLGVASSRVHTLWSTSKDLGQSGMRFGCVVSQGDPNVPRELSGRLANSTSTLSSRVTCEVLNSQQLPDLLSLNENRLEHAYSEMTLFFKERGVEYYPCDSGPYVCANFAPHVERHGEVDEIVRKLEDAGVYLFPLYAFHTPPAAKGWVRLNFAIDPKDLQLALRRLREVWNTLR